MRIFLVFAISLSTLVIEVPGLTRSDPTIRDAIDRYLTTRMEMGNFSGAVLVAKDKQIVIRKGFGFADISKRIPFTPETKHSIASISKMFTSMAVLKLRAKGKLGLDDSICKYIRGCPDAWRPVTIQHLMRNVSGIPDYEEPLELGSAKYLEFMLKPGSSKLIVDNAKKLPLDFKPGEKFKYSNTGYIVLSVIVETAGGRSFAEILRDEILGPAGMKHAGVFDGTRQPAGIAKGYTYGSLPWEKSLAGVSLSSGHLIEIPNLPLAPPHGDGGMYATVDDLLKWSEAMDGGKVVSTQEAAEVYTPGLAEYGYGWFVGKGFERKRYRHNGSLPGYVSDLIKFPDDRITIVIFSNVDRARLSSIARDISAIVLGTPYDMPVRGNVIKLTLEQAARLEGVYRMADGKILTVKNEPDYLTAQLEGRYTAGLIPLSPTEFYFPLGDGRAIFTIDDTGKAKTANMRYSGEDHIAERVK